MPVEEADAEPVLELDYVPADGRLLDTQGACGATKLRVIRSGQKIAQMAKVGFQESARLAGAINYGSLQVRLQ